VKQQAAAILSLAATGGFLLAGCGAKTTEINVAPAVSKTGTAATKPAAEQSELPDGWKILSSQSGNYQVLMPAKTQNKTLTIPSKAGNLKAYMVTASLPSPETAYIMSHVEYPSQVDKMDKQKMLDDARDAVAKKGRKIVSEKQIEMNGFPGRELVITAEEKGQNLRMDAQMFLINRRLYQLLVVSTDGRRPENADDFFSSLKLLKPVAKNNKRNQ
jgi:hypothetical protein